MPNTEPVTDRERHNFCEEFAPAIDLEEKKRDVDEISKNLFNESEPLKKSDFNSLFDD